MLNALPAPLTENWLGVIWILIRLNHRRTSDLCWSCSPERQQARTLQVIVFCVFLPRCPAAPRDVWGAAPPVPPAAPQPRPKAAALPAKALQGSPIQWGEGKFSCLILPIKSHFPQSRVPPELRQECVGPDKNSFPFVCNAASQCCRQKIHLNKPKNMISFLKQVQLGDEIGAWN